MEEQVSGWVGEGGGEGGGLGVWKRRKGWVGVCMGDAEEGNSLSPRQCAPVPRAEGGTGGECERSNCSMHRLSSQQPVAKTVCAPSRESLALLAQEEAQEASVSDPIARRIISLPLLQLVTNTVRSLPQPATKAVCPQHWLSLVQHATKTVCDPPVRRRRPRT